VKDGAVQFLSIAALSPAPANARKDLGNIDELAESIAVQGLLHPIVVREITKDQFEIVCGHRRFMACKKLGLKDVKCSVIAASDDGAAAIRAVENLQRKDLSLFESAAELEKLRAAGLTWAEIADRLGKPASWVARRAKLLALSPKIMEDLKSKDNPLAAWTPAMFEMLARYKEAVQNQVARRTWITDVERLREALKEFEHRLADAPFKTDDAELIPAAGACDTCVKRTSAEPTLFEDYDVKKDDTCLDPACFTRKKNELLVIKERTLREQNPDLVLVNDGYGGNNGGLFKGKSVLPSWNVRSAKKGDKGAVAALVVAGDKAGKTIYIKKPAPNEVEKAEPKKDPEKEKRERIEAAQVTHYCAGCLKWLEKQKKSPGDYIKAMPLKTVYALIYAFGAAAEDDYANPLKLYMKAPKIADADIPRHLAGAVINQISENCYSFPRNKAAADWLYEVFGKTVKEIEDLWTLSVLAHPLPKAVAAKKPDKAKAADAKCRVCGCSEAKACVDKNGKACHWVEADLCSACASNAKKKKQTKGGGKKSSSSTSSKEAAANE